MIPYRIIAVPALYLLLLGLFYHPVHRLFTQHVLGGTSGDPGLYIWLLQDFSWERMLEPSTLQQSSMLYPFGSTRAFSDNYLLPSMLVGLLGLIGLSLPLSYNLVILSTILLNGFCTFALILQLSKRWWPSFWGGFVFMVLPFFFVQHGHPQLQFAFFFPALLLLSLRFFERRSFFHGTLIGALLCASFLCSVYYALFGLLLLSCTFLAYVLLRPHTITLKDTCILLAANIPWGFLLAWLAAPYTAVKNVFGRRSIRSFGDWGLEPMSFLSLPESNRLWGALTHSLSHYESYLSPGLLALLLACLSAQYFLDPEDRPGLIKRLMAFFLPIAFFLIGANFFSKQENLENMLSPDGFSILSAGSLWIFLFYCLLVLGSEGVQAYRKSASLELSLREQILLLSLVGFVFFFAGLGILGGMNNDDLRFGLYVTLYRYVPGFDAVRATGRFGVVCSLVIIVLAALGLRLLCSHGSSKQQTVLSILLGTFALGFSFFELRSHAYPSSPLSSAPPIYQYVKTLSPHPLVILPFGQMAGQEAEWAKRQVRYMLWSQISGNQTVNGYSGVIPRFQSTLHDTLKGFPDARSLRTLSQVIGLSYIVYHPAEEPNFNPESFASQLEAHAEDIRLLQRDEQGNYLLQLSPRLRAKSIETYAPPEPRKKRILWFRARSVDTQETTLSVVDAGVKERPAPTVREIPLSDIWGEYQVEISASASPVLPHKVRFLAKGGAFEIRDLKIRS